MSSITATVQSFRSDLAFYKDLYKKIHANPELSHLEMETAASITRHLRQLNADFEIRERIGGHGLFAILRNGEGKTVMLRADMDALPVLERTGVDYASIKRQFRSDGQETAVMHGGKLRSFPCCSAL